MIRRQNGHSALVEPIPPILAKRLEQPSSSRRPAGQTAYASKDLLAALHDSRRRRSKTNQQNGDQGEHRTGDEIVGVAISWPRERRLRGKGKGKEENLIIWVIPVFEDVSIGSMVCLIIGHN